MNALNSRICLAIPGTDNFNTPIAELSESLALAASKICNNLLHVSGIIPLPRFTVPECFTTSHLVVSKDGSAIGFSCTIHLISSNQSGDTHSQIVKASNRLKHSSAPGNEAYDCNLAVETLDIYLEGIYHLIKPDTGKLPIFISGDSLTTILAFCGQSSDVSIWTAVG